jgi:hypothetical protein
MKFKAKLDWWFYLLIIIGFISVIYLSIMIILNRNTLDIIFCAVSLFPLIFLIRIGIGFYYILTEASLVIKCGKLVKSQTILYGDIESVTVLASGRLMIKYKFKKRILTGLLWVKDREEFMKQINEKLNIQGM